MHGLSGRILDVTNGCKLLAELRGIAPLIFELPAFRSVFAPVELNGNSYTIPHIAALPAALTRISHLLTKNGQMDFWAGTG
jgi:hypothetical protein